MLPSAAWPKTRVPNPNRYRCPACRTRRTDWLALLAHCNAHGHGLCTCGGYHFAHRPGSPCCEKNPMGPLHSAIRADSAGLAEIEMDCVWHGAGREMKTWSN